MAITDKHAKPPIWECGDCKSVFSGSEVSPEIANLDDVHDVFSKHRGERLNICPKCGGSLRLRRRDPD